MPENGVQHNVSAQEFHKVANRLLSLALTQHSLRDFISEALREALRITGGLRAFAARIEQESGQLVVVDTAGAGWTRKNRKLRLEPHHETQRGITGYVAITGEPYRSGNVAEDTHHLRLFEDAQSEMAVPFFDVEGRVRGVLNIDSDRLDAFDDLHVAQVTTLANAVATALAFEEFRTRERLLVDIGLDLASITEIDSLAGRVVDVAAKALQCDGCSVFLYEETSQTLKLRAAKGSLSKRIGEAVYRPGEGLTGTVFQTGEVIRLDDPRSDPRWIGRFPEFVSSESSSFLAVPVVGREKILGVLRVSRPKSKTAWFRARFTESDERMLGTIAGQFGTAIENIASFNKSVRSERMAAWGELSAKSAHMIGNRTFAIKGDINELKYMLSRCTEAQNTSGSRASDTPEILNTIGTLTDSIEHGVFRLEEILREFRDFVMATQLKQVKSDLNKTVREAVHETFPRRSGIVLDERYAQGGTLCRYDIDKVKRALSELIENAISFMPNDQGSLHVGTQLIAAGDQSSRAQLSPMRSYICISVEDSGPGVPSELKPQIFNPFFSSRVKGMGLGLSIVKGIVDAHHGIIRETGVPGQGARFEIYLPVDSDAEPVRQK